MCRQFFVTSVIIFSFGFSAWGQTPQASKSKQTQQKQTRANLPKLKTFECVQNEDLRALRKRLEEYELRLQQLNGRLTKDQLEKLWLNKSDLGQGLTYFHTEIFWDPVIQSRRKNRECHPLYVQFKDALKLNDKVNAPQKLEIWLACFRPLYGVDPSEAIRLRNCVQGAIQLIESKQK